MGNGCFMKSPEAPIRMLFGSNRRKFNKQPLRNQAFVPISFVRFPRATVCWFRRDTMLSGFALTRLLLSMVARFSQILSVRIKSSPNDPLKRWRLRESLLSEKTWSAPRLGFRIHPPFSEPNSPLWNQASQCWERKFYNASKMASPCHCPARKQLTLWSNATSFSVWTNQFRTLPWGEPGRTSEELPLIESLKKMSSAVLRPNFPADNAHSGAIPLSILLQNSFSHMSTKRSEYSHGMLSSLSHEMTKKYLKARLKHCFWTTQRNGIRAASLKIRMHGSDLRRQENLHLTSG
jgi:hypothetical protein